MLPALFMRSFLGLPFFAALIFCSSTFIPNAGQAQDTCPENSFIEIDKLEIKPMDSPPASVTDSDGRKAILFPCNFSQANALRNSWDFSLKKDLSASNGISFEIKCANPTPVLNFSIYFHSGNGWYHKSFFPDSDELWKKVTCMKDDFRTEGNPSGWDKIDTMRISAWLAEKQDTEFSLANFAAIGSPSSELAIVLNDSAVLRKSGESNSIFQYSKSMSSMLDGLGLKYRILSDLDLDSEKLKGVKLVVIPYSPDLDDKAADTIAEFLERGGKLIVFFIVHPKLQKACGLKTGNFITQPAPGFFSEIRTTPEKTIPGMPGKILQKSWNVYEMLCTDAKGKTIAYWHDGDGKNTGIPALVLTGNTVFMSHVLVADDIENKKIMLLSMAGYFLPDLLKQAANFAVSGIGVETNDAVSERRTLQSLVDHGKYQEAIISAGISKGKLLGAFCDSLPSEKNENRLFWCHDPFGIMGKSWDETIKTLSANGFTDIIPNMLCAGTAYYKSELLPVAPEIQMSGDQIEKCLIACRKYGVKCHIWKVNWNCNGKAPDSFMDKIRAEKRLQVDYKGKTTDCWLCPSSKENHALEVESMLEIVQKYDVDGIHFDYIRFPDENHCFCGRCKSEFEKFAGEKMKDWPKDARSSKYAGKWCEFRRGLISSVVREVSERARKIRPSIKISAAVFSNWQTDRDSVGQDWRQWCEDGYLDFICPMNYTESNLKFDNLLKKQKFLAGKVPVYPGIGLSTWLDHDKIRRLVRQIEISRKNNCGGFTIFNLDEDSATKILPLLGRGITKP